ncbi:MAG: LacI family DNA-binding transcriptional regulator [Lachnospiraceae bacterium]|nr:LacI family DNA-binding transcriptional regulator [Lachnospiraceae bacterium]
MVSMKDISKKVGVSVATVSKALNDHSDIGEATKQRVRDAAREMGYFPNASARTLKTNKSHNIGVLFRDEAGNGFTHDFYAAVLDSLKKTAEAKGYDISFINSSKGIMNMNYLEHCKYRGYDGVVLACIDFDDPDVVELATSDMPVVTIDHTFDNRTAIISDNVTGIRELVTYIYKDCGHRKIAYIHGADSSVTRNRLASFYATMEDLGAKVPDEYVKDGVYRKPEVSYNLTLELLDLKDPPTCIIYPDDFSAIGGINAIQSRGLSIPGDISIAGYDGIRIAKVLEPKLATIEQDTDTIGELAARRLVQMIERPKSSIPERVVVEGKLLKGDSVKALLA